MLRVFTYSLQKSNMKWSITKALFKFCTTSHLFKITLFADDTLLQLSDCNIKKLEKWVNNELNKINVWLRNNKISLNISCYVMNRFCWKFVSMCASFELATLLL